MVQHKASHNPGGGRFLQCQRCPEKFFAFEWQLTRHKETTHPSQQTVGGEEVHYCDECHRVYCTKRGLDAHIMRAHLGPYRCTVCGLRYPTMDVLAQHVAWHTTTAAGERGLHHCRVCQRTFSRPWQVQRHMRVHTGVSTHGCDFCEDHFSTIAERDGHVLLEHPSIVGAAATVAAAAPIPPSGTASTKFFPFFIT
jgi:hypothetical protein